jgi:hypothetical protein
VQGQICDFLRPQLAMNRFLSLWPHFRYIHLGGGGVGGALILDRCRAFDLLASVDAHLWIDAEEVETEGENHRGPSQRVGCGGGGVGGGESEGAESEGWMRRGRSRRGRIRGG